MFQNLKVDVIYYKTNTDFEMEFNLCGCCRMRLLTDKSPDKKAMVHSLARAVSRSKIIMVVGNLFGEEGITRLAASAIGSTLAVADNKAYGISGDESIEIINGSIPLVTAEGYFGGCIIESGPQTLILLSENKSIRKAVMKALIHPYIEELSAIELKSKTEAVSEETAFDEEAEQELTQADEVAEELEIEDENEALYEEEEPELIIDQKPIDIDDEIVQDESYIAVEDNDSDIEMRSVAEDDDDGMYVDSDIIFEDTEMKMRDFVRRNEEYYNEQDTVRGLLTEDDEFYPKKRGILNLPIFIISIILLVLFIVLCYCIFYIPSKDGVSASLYISEIFNTLFG